MRSTSAGFAARDREFVDRECAPAIEVEEEEEKKR